MQQPGSITFGTPLAPTTGATGTFGGFGAGLNQQSTFGSPNTGLKFGAAPATTQSNLFGGGLTAPATNFGAPTSTAATSTGFSFGTNPPQAQQATGGLNFGAQPIATATTTAAGFSFGGTPATSTPNTGLNFSTFNKPASSGIGGTSTAQTLNFGLGGTNTAATPIQPPGTTGSTLFTGGSTLGGGGGGLFGPKPITSTTTPTLNPIVSQQQTPNIGLGGVDTFQNKPGTIGGAQTKESEGKLTKEQQLPNEFLQLIDGFKNHVKQQKMYSSDVARGTVKPLRKIQEDIDQLKAVLVELGNNIGISRQQAEKLKFETAKCLSHAEMAQRIHDTPPGFQIDNTAPLQYFIETVHKFENDLSAIRQQIEATEKHIKSLERSKPLSSQEMTLGLRRLHETFVALAGRLQSLHSQVEMQKTQYLNMRKYLFKDNMNVLFEQQQSSSLNNNSNQLKQLLNQMSSIGSIGTRGSPHNTTSTSLSFTPPKRAAGPTPFSTLGKNTLSFISTTASASSNSSQQNNNNNNGVGGSNTGGANQTTNMSSTLPPPAYPGSSLNWGGSPASNSTILGGGGGIKTTQPPSYNASIGIATNSVMFGGATPGGVGGQQQPNDFQLQKPPTGNKRGFS